MDQPATIGHNSAGLSLDEQIEIKTIDFRSRMRELVDSATRAGVTDAETAAKATLLVKMIKDHAGEVEAARVALKAPFLESGRIVDAHFGAIKTQLSDAATAVTAAINGWQKAQLSDGHTGKIDTGYGVKASVKEAYAVEIDSFPLALKHALKIDEFAIMATVKAVYDAQVKAGVRKLPGARVIQTIFTVIR